MLTTCPNCSHVFDHGVATFSPSSSCCASRPMLLSATLQLPPSSVPTTCTVAVTTVSHPRVLAGMAGGGIVDTTFFVDQQDKSLDQQSTSAGIPQSSPSTPLSFVLPTPTTNASVPRVANLMPFQWTTASIQPTIQMAPWMMNTMQPTSFSHPPSRPTVIPQVPQSETDLVRLAATLNALRASGWYYEGLSWQESQEALQSTPPGTFLVRDSSDPRYLFSLSVQTERGPTSIRLHYVMGQFRLDAEPRLAPMMPLFECVVKLVEYYIALTKESRSNTNKCNRKLSRDKEQVWVDARGQLYSHILLTTPLYKKLHRPSLQHLARLAINKQMSKTSDGIQGVTKLPLPIPLVDYLKEYPYTH